MKTKMHHLPTTVCRTTGLLNLAWAFCLLALLALPVAANPQFSPGDSWDFALDTRGADSGATVIKTGVEAPGSGGQLASALRVGKNGTSYAILLVPVNWPDASRVRVQTAAGPKAWRKVP